MEIVESVIKRIKGYLKDTEECIEYPILNTGGYGEMQTYLNGKKKHYRMHRVAFQVYTGIDITIDNIICHKCDNPSCVNPKHLFIGTHKDNSDDKVSKGRQAKGASNGQYKHGNLTKESKAFRKANPDPKAKSRAVLSEEKVKEIKDLITKKEISLVAISNIVGVNYNTIRDISSGRVYKEK
jgi:hypothetical protein